MPALSALLPVAACAGGMYLCMRLMMRRPDRLTSPPDTEVAQLREEVARLRAELADRDRVSGR